jgi:hypothetical protein
MIQYGWGVRNGAGLVLALVDWRVLVVISLAVYSNVQAATQPFKLAHESTLDNTCVLLLMCLYTAHIGKDQVVAAAGLADRDAFLVVVLVCSTLILVLMTVRGRHITKRLIRFVPLVLLWLVTRLTSSHQDGVGCYPRQSVVKHLGTSMLATEVARTAVVRERVREVARQQSAVAAFRAGASPVRQRAGHSTVPPSFKRGPPMGSLKSLSLCPEPHDTRSHAMHHWKCARNNVQLACCAMAEGLNTQQCGHGVQSRRLAAARPSAARPRRPSRYVCVPSHCRVPTTRLKLGWSHRW